MMRPRSSFIVMGTPRSGTSLLCNLLERTEVAGRPNEYFWRDEAGRLWKDWAVSDEETYLTKVMEMGTTPNGVFGLKLMWTYLDDALAFLRRVTGTTHLNDAELLRSVFPDPRFICVWRNDLVAQGVSWAKAEQTGEWYEGDPRRSSEAPAFDFNQVHSLVLEATRLQAVGKRWFGRHGVAPFMVCYEDLVDDMDATVRAVLGFLGMDFPEGGRVGPSLRPQADAVNSEWTRLYRETVRLHPRG